MHVYRVSKEKYRSDLTGHGANAAGGRWNRSGTVAIYTSESRALAVLEYAVHVPIGLFPTNLVLLTIEIPPRSSIYHVRGADMPRDWKRLPPPTSTQTFGDKLLLSSSHVAYSLPSIIVEHEFNYLINPAHPQMDGIKIIEVIPFEFDKRLKG